MTVANMPSALHGCQFRHVEDVTADGQPIGPLCGAPALSVWSRMVSWRDM